MPTFSVILPKCVSRGKYLNIDKKVIVTNLTHKEQHCSGISGHFQFSSLLLKCGTIFSSCLVLSETKIHTLKGGKMLFIFKM